jgi:hypothetical protein
VLGGISCFVTGRLGGSIRLENQGASGVTPVFQPRASVVPTLPGGVFFPVPQPTYSQPLPALASFDGLVDYAGASGITLAITNANDLKLVSLSTVTDLDPWIGPAGGGSITLSFTSTNLTSPPVPANVQDGSTIESVAFVTVIYSYQASPARFCTYLNPAFCPCGALGSPMHGCANSANPAGGRMDLLGTASLSNDTLVFPGSSMTNAAVLYFQGDSYTLSGSAFGNGRRCVFGNLVRLGVKVNSGGSSRYPDIGDPAVSVQGLVSAPGMRAYQAYYRDFGGSCPAGTFNITNGMVVTWIP